jgi:hypothetical protein
MRPLLCALLTLIPGCSSEEGTQSSPIAAAPAPIKLQSWACRSGWTPAPAAGAYQLCLPPAVMGSCKTGEVQLPGEPGCRVLGTPCPAGDFLDEASLRVQAPGFSGKIRYVKPGATGTATRQDPAGDIGTTMLLAAPGDIVALSRGTFQQKVMVKADVALVGACVSGTVITPTAPSDTHTSVELPQGGARMANLQVTGPRAGIWILAKDRPVQLQAIELHKTRGYALYVTDGGRGDLKDIVVRDTQAQSTGPGGFAVAVFSGGQITAERVVLERNQDAGVTVFDPGSALTLRDVVLRDTRPRADTKESGYGAVIQDGARLTVEGGVIENSHEKAFEVTGKGATLVLTDAVVRDTQPCAKDNASGMGLVVGQGAGATLTRALFEGNRSMGVAVTTGASLTAADLVVRKTGSEAKGKRWGIGLVVMDGAKVKARGLVLDGNRSIGLYADVSSDQLPEVEIEDLWVKGTLPEEKDGGGGRALEVNRGASVKLTRALLAGNHEAAVLCTHAGTHLRVTDVTIRDTESEQAGGTMGRGLEVNRGARVTIERAVIENNREEGVFAAGKDTAVELSDTVVRGTRRSACATVPEGQPGSCRDLDVVKVNGAGVTAIDHASVKLGRFELDTNHTAGLVIALDGEIAASHGRVQGHPVGANVQNKGYDLSKIFGDTVDWSDNTEKLFSGEISPTTLKSLKSRGLRGN